MSSCMTVFIYVASPTLPVHPHDVEFPSALCVVVNHHPGAKYALPVAGLLGQMGNASALFAGCNPSRFPSARSSQRPSRGCPCLSYRGKKPGGAPARRMGCATTVPFIRTTHRRVLGRRSCRVSPGPRFGLRLRLEYRSGLSLTYKRAISRGKGFFWHPHFGENKGRLVPLRASDCQGITGFRAVFQGFALFPGVAGRMLHCSPGIRPRPPSGSPPNSYTISSNRVISSTAASKSSSGSARAARRAGTWKPSDTAVAGGRRPRVVIIVKETKVARPDRPALNRLLGQLEPGDTVVVTHLAAQPVAARWAASVRDIGKMAATYAYWTGAVLKRAAKDFPMEAPE